MTTSEERIISEVIFGPPAVGGGEVHADKNKNRNTRRHRYTSPPSLPSSFFLILPFRRLFSTLLCAPQTLHTHVRLSSSLCDNHTTRAAHTCSPPVSRRITRASLSYLYTLPPLFARRETRGFPLLSFRLLSRAGSSVLASSFDARLLASLPALFRPPRPSHLSSLQAQRARPNGTPSNLVQQFPKFIRQTPPSPILCARVSAYLYASCLSLNSQFFFTICVSRLYLMFDFLARTHGKLTFIHASLAGP